MSVTIGIFINPGKSRPPSRTSSRVTNRSFEYDSLGDQYARFLLEEILPKSAANITSRKIRKVARFAGSVPAHLRVDGRVGAAGCVPQSAEPRRQLHQHSRRPRLSGAGIRKTEKKPIRVFLQDGANDLDNLHGNWPLAKPGDGGGVEIRQV